MSIVQAIQAGRQAGDMTMPRMIDPGQALNAIQGSTPAIRPTRGTGAVRPAPMSPAQIHQSAAAEALTIAQQEEELRAKKLANDKMEQDAAIARQAAEDNASRSFAETQAIQQKTSQGDYAAGMASSKAWADADTAVKKNQYDMAMKSMIAGDTAPFLNYMRTYGDKNTNLTGIEFSPDGNEVLVSIEGKPKPMLMDRTKFMAFIGAFDPKVMESISNIATKQAEAERKAKELSLKEEANVIAKENKQSDSERKQMDSLHKIWAAESLDPMGNLKEGATPWETYYQNAIKKKGSNGPAIPKSNVGMTEKERKTGKRDENRQNAESPIVSGKIPKGAAVKKTGEMTPEEAKADVNAKADEMRNTPPVEGAKKAKDGNWYVKRGGKWNKVVVE